MHRDLGYPVAVQQHDPFIERIVYGRKAEQGEDRQLEVGPALPARAVWDMVQRGLREPDLHTLRALTAVAVTYRAVLRSDSSVSTQPPDVYVERVPPGADLACQVCGRTDREDIMVLCDRCDHGVHADCAGLPGVPADDWY